MLSKHQRLFPGLFIVTFIVYIMFCLNLSSMSSRLNKNIQLDKKIEQSFFTTSKHSTESPTILFQTTVFGKTPRSASFWGHVLRQSSKMFIKDCLVTEMNVHLNASTHQTDHCLTKQMQLFFTQTI